MDKQIRILPVIVLYKEELSACRTFNSLLKGYDALYVVYDNSPKAQTFDHISNKANLVYMHDPANGGLSKAYNIAARYACEHNYQWILLLDQDTAFPEGLIEQYVTAIRNHPEENLFCCRLRLANGKLLSPNAKYSFLRKKTLPPGQHEVKRYPPINSGMCVRLKSFWEAGGYNEAVKLDFSDFQFIDRYAQNNTSFYLIDATAIQNFSDQETDVEALNNRFLLYIDGIKNSTKKNIFHKFYYYYLAFRRATSLAARTKKTIFIRTLFQNIF